MATIKENPVGMGIGTFYSQAVKRDFSRDFQMRVIDIGPGNIIGKDDNVYITTTTLPGYAIANQSVPFMGMNFNIPGSGNFPGSDSWAVTFRCDAQLNIREKFIAWQKTIFNSFPNEASNSVGAYGPKSVDTIASVVVLNRDGSTARGMKLIGIYPVSVADLTYDATANGNIVTMNVTLAYQYWVADDSLSVGKPSGGSFASIIA